MQYDRLSQQQLSFLFPEGLSHLCRKNISTAPVTRSSATAEKQRVSCPHGEELGPPAHFPSAPSGYTYAHGRIRNPQQTNGKMNRAFKVIQGHPYWCRQEPRVVCCRNVQLMPTLFLKLTKIRQREHSKFVDFNAPLKFEDVPSRNAFEYLQSIYIARN